MVQNPKSRSGRWRLQKHFRKHEVDTGLVLFATDQRFDGCKPCMVFAPMAQVGGTAHSVVYPWNNTAPTKSHSMALAATGGPAMDRKRKRERMPSTEDIFRQFPYAKSPSSQQHAFNIQKLHSRGGAAEFICCMRRNSDSI
jgi:hypothetical protein